MVLSGVDWSSGPDIGDIFVIQLNIVALNFSEPAIREGESELDILIYCVPSYPSIL